MKRLQGSAQAKPLASDRFWVVSPMSAIPMPRQEADSPFPAHIQPLNSNQLNGRFWETNFQAIMSLIGAVAEGPLSAARHPIADSLQTAQ